MREIGNVKQLPGEPFRKWFANRTFDLIVWFSEDGKEMVGFQLCYRMGPKEKAFTWQKENGFSHKRVDDGECGGFRHKMTPILLPDGVFDPERIAEAFEKAALTVEEPLRRQIAGKLREYKAEH
ncbi:MAG: hypothetical protein C0404_14745 [Verrucomicrobia bacterium]|nr:hypothetical protein [Verrucomicrobiota bacterium]